MINYMQAGVKLPRLPALIKCHAGALGVEVSIIIIENVLIDVIRKF